MMLPSAIRPELVCDQEYGGATIFRGKVKLKVKAPRPM